MAGTFGLFDIFWYLPLVLVVYAHIELPDDVQRRDWGACAVKLAFIGGGYALMALLWPIVFAFHSTWGRLPGTTENLIVGIILALLLGAFVLMSLGHAVHYTQRRSWGQSICSLLAAGLSAAMIAWWWIPLVSP